jgi:hypothetical protein
MAQVVARAVAGTEPDARPRCIPDVMRRPTAAMLALAVLLAAPAPAGAKGPVAMSVCGANGCHRVDRVAVRDGVDAYTRAAALRSAEAFFNVRARARVSSGRVVEVFALDWLPSAGLTRADGERSWTRPSPALAAALRHAAQGLRPHPAAELGSVADGPPTARVVEVFAPTGKNAHDGPGGTAIAGALALAALLGLTLARRR